MKENLIFDVNEENMLSIICVYNDENKLKKLIKSCDKIKEDIEWILINNINKQFRSAAAALNYGFKKATSDILIFLHQDIIFHDCFKLIYFQEIFYQYGDCIIGVAGVEYTDSEKDNRVISNIHDGINGTHIYKCNINDMKEVFTVDECFLATTRNVMKNVLFDEKLGWHFYGADLCIQGACQGYKTYVIPIDLTHYSAGTIDLKYYKSLNIFVKKWKKKYTYLSTTTMWIEAKRYKPFRYYIWRKYPWTLKVSINIMSRIKKLK